MPQHRFLLTVLCAGCTAIACESVLGIEPIDFQPDAGVDASTDAVSDAPDTQGADGQPDGDSGPDDGGFDADADAAPPPPVIIAPGCAPEVTCGPDNVSCCESRLVPGGDYSQGCTWSETTPCITDAYGPEHPSTVAPFYLDTFEVTGKRFETFVEDYNLWRSNGHPADGEAEHPEVPNSGWRTSWTDRLPETSTHLEFHVYCDAYPPTSEDFYTYDPFNEPNRPINCVSWLVAFAFCTWNGGRLPTEAEWEFAGAGGKDNRLYPWGDDEPTPAHANYVADGEPLPPKTLRVFDVGHFPLGKSKYGHYDMGGSMAEWLLDRDGRDWYKAPPGNPCDNCANLGTPDDDLLQRGGNWRFTKYDMLNAKRFSNSGTVRSTYSGIRCARDIPE